jgi:hypothetical protein
MFITVLHIRSAALKSLQGAGGAYCLVTVGQNHGVRGGTLRGFVEGDNIRVIRPKVVVKARRQSIGQSIQEEGIGIVKRGVGYGLKMTFDLPVGRSVGILTVRACWHDVVFRNELGFTEKTFIY